MKNIFKNLILFSVSLFLTVIAAEYALYYFYPISVTNVGYADRPNGLKYGWGFYPNELVRVEDPDTSIVYYDHVNNAGWRDRDRQIENKNDAFRVLVLGDSMTFGYLVPKEKTFTNILENKLKSAGVNAEVINISYSGWGTDQAYEALRLEGQHYKPDLVIYHFVSNDMQDNTWHLDTGKSGARKPFYYDVEGNSVSRKVNKRFEDEFSSWTRKKIISKSEILKRLWIVTRSMKHKRKEPYFYDSLVDGRIRYFLEIAQDHPLFKNLQSLPEKFMESDFELAAAKSNLTPEQKEKLSVILTQTEGNKAELIDGDWEREDFSKYHWTLTRHLIMAISKLSKSFGGDFAVLSDHEEGRYQWDRAWLRVADGQKAREQYFELNAFLESTAAAIDADLIPSPVPHKRARFDSHVNVQGNEAIAENIYLYLKNTYPDLNIP
ncbi:GDSL-type esterase/lipase family protein [Thalassospiraceae bacterium LMO-JJ14]|nr:GDSL-type esterase/lipase family protein [Thalassospiraceae bacterium LMO-JJ14]